jgi:hypothetical protein
MERPASWKVLTLGVALAGIGVAGADAAQADTDSGSSGTAPASVSPAPLFNEPRLFASGSGGGDWDNWGPGEWGPGGFPNVGGCVSATGPFGYVSGSVCV